MSAPTPQRDTYAQRRAAELVTCDECGKTFSGMGINPHRAMHRRRTVEGLVSTGIDVAEAEVMANESTWTADDVVTMMRTVGADDSMIERMIDLMDFIGKIKRGEA